MNKNSWSWRERTLSISFYASNDSNLPEQISIQPWHQPHAIPEKKIRAGMLQFLVEGPHPDELAFLPLFLHLYEDIVGNFVSYLHPPMLNVCVLVGRAAPFGFYSESPLGFTEEEIEKLRQEVRKPSKVPPNLERLGLTGTVVDIRELRSVPPVFERVSSIRDQKMQLIVLGIHDQPADILLPALLGRFFHGLGHVLVADRVSREKNEEIAQSWATAITKALRDYSHGHPHTLGQLSREEYPLFPEAKSLLIERILQGAIPATFSSELSEQKDFFKLLEEAKKMLQ
ncbi:MAG: hypothetical protein ACXACI_07170 [Candidatus Hodarchaeales archaeon]|jgi:hypothetical protein